VIFAALAAGPALGQEATIQAVAPVEPQPAPPKSDRGLDGHVFIPSRILPGPFAVTAFGLETLGGGGNAESSTFDIAGTVVGGKRYPLAVAGQEFDFQVRLVPDVALRFSGGGLALAGIDGPGLLAVGLTAAYGFSGGLVAGADLGCNTRLSFVGDATYQPNLTVAPANAVVRALATHVFNAAGLFTDVRRLQGNPGLSFAWAPFPWMGLVVESRYLWSRRVTSEATPLVRQWATAGAVLDFDLDPVAHVPLGFLAEYNTLVPISNATRIQQAGGGIFYTGKVHLALGLEVLWQKGELQLETVPHLDARAILGSIVLRYYW
jgi:hypothetical protein